MQTKIRAGDPCDVAAELLAVPLHRPSGKTAKRSGAAKKSARARKPRLKLPPGVQQLDHRLGGVIAAAVATGDFDAAAGQTTLLYPAASAETAVERVLLVGLGPVDKLDREALRRAAGSAARGAGKGRNKRVSLWLPETPGIEVDDALQALAEGALLGSYRFDDYRDLGEGDPGSVGSFTVFVGETRVTPARRRALERGRIVAESQNLARDLSNAPGNELPPAALASEARKVARAAGLRCEVMDVAELKRRKMGGILAVGGGSARPPRLIVLEHKPKRSGKKTPTICLVGKGVTFDSGGISIKPSAGMEDMKHDMGGAAAVIGAMSAVARLELPLHVVGVIGAAENLPSGSAYRPGDVVRTASGKTIEVLNTDAEGRVVLADALHYARTRFAPEAMVDLATLTGACMVALGEAASGLFGTDDDLIERVRSAGETAGERAWPMPLLDEHRRAVKSTIADVKNSAGRDAGASTAAAFLAAFVGDTPWVHLDIAGTGWTSNVTPCQIKGGTGVGVRLLVQLLQDW